MLKFAAVKVMPLSSNYVKATEKLKFLQRDGTHSADYDVCLSGRHLHPVICYLVSNVIITGHTA